MTISGDLKRTQPLWTYRQTCRSVNPLTHTVAMCHTGLSRHLLYSCTHMATVGVKGLNAPPARKSAGLSEKRR